MHMSLQDLWDLPVSVYDELVVWAGEITKASQEP